MENHATNLLGDAPAINGRFPLLVKLIDAVEDLSIQVHPPDIMAGQLGGEPKTEAWYIAHADPGARIYAGLKNDTTRETFESNLRDGTLAECVHCLDVKTGEAMFLPSGRLHALGGGTVVIEVQQNSDTTYRVFDWNRTGLDGQPRELHIEQALASIDFNDIEPTLCQIGAIVDEPGLFRMESRVLAPGETANCSGLCVVGVASGAAVLDEIELSAGSFALVPACVGDAVARAGTETVLILARPA
jgi:mannose-6-phosphate isomerase